MISSTITSRDLVSWLRWADQGANKKEKEDRAAKVWAHVFPEGLDPFEKSMRETTVEYLRTIGEPSSWDGWPEPTPPPTESATSQPNTVEVLLRPFAPPKTEEEPWDGLISKKLPAYMRGSRHDGTASAVERMQSLAKGSPFDADEDARPAPPRKVEVPKR